MFRRLISRSPTSVASRFRHQLAFAAQLGQEAEIDVVGYGLGFEEALELAVFGHIDDAVAHCRRRNEIADRLVVQKDFAAIHDVSLDHTGDDLEGLGASGTDQAEHAGDLPGENRQRVVFHHRRHAQVLDRQYALPCGSHGGFALAIKGLRQIASDHRLNDSRPIKILLVDRSRQACRRAIP